MPKKLSKEAEARIITAIHDVVGHVQDGLSPVAAVVKVAEAERLPQHFVKLVCTGYNVGATNYQREQHDDVLQKYADFPLADYDEVAAKLWPAKVETPAAVKAASAVSAEYSQPPATARFRQQEALVKAANCNLGPWRATAAAAPVAKASPTDKLAAIRREVAQARTERNLASDRFYVALGRAGDWFKQAAADFAEVDYVVQRKLGDVGRAVMDCLYARNPRHGYKRASQQQRQQRLANWSQAPYSLINDCVQAAQELSRKEAALQRLLPDAADRSEQELAPFYPPTEQSVLCQQTKRAAGNLSMLLGGALTKTMIDSAAKQQRTPEQRVQGMVDSLADPQHEAALREIQTRAMLQDLLQNDEVISGYNPDEVLSAYNEMSQLSPMAATQPALVRPYLRKRMTQGTVEPFEAAEMTNVEKTLNLNRQPAFESKVGHVLKQRLFAE